LSGRCAAVRSLFGAYLDDTLDPSDRLSVRSHLRQCQTCRQEVSVVEPTLIFTRLTEPRVSADEVNDILESVRGAVALRIAEGKLARSRAASRRRTAGLASAAAALFALSLAIRGDHGSAIRNVDRSNLGSVAARTTREGSPSARVSPSGATVYEWDPGKRADEPRVVWIVDRSLDI
jgi:anti-sigma factor RsiW